MEVSGRVASDEPSSAFAGLGQRGLVSRMHEQLDELLAARRHMLETLREAAEIADGVAVRVLKGLRLHAIDERGLPPGLRGQARAHPARTRERLRGGEGRKQQRGGEDVR